MCKSVQNVPKCAKLCRADRADRAYRANRANRDTKVENGITDSLTGLTCRDASASKKLLDMLHIDPRGVRKDIALIFF